MDMSIISNDRAHADGSNWRTDEEVMDMYEHWLLKQGKVYNGLGEKEKRFQIFKDNLRFIDEQNAENRTYKMGLNKFADLTHDEFVDKHLGITRIDPKRSIAKTRSNCCAPHVGDNLLDSVYRMEETDSKMWPELLAKAFIDVMAKTQMSEALATWAEASKAKAEAYKEKAERYKGEKSNEEATFSSDYSLAKCVIALDEIGHVHEDCYMKALEILKDDPEWREISLSLTPSRKQQWLYCVNCGRLAPDISDEILTYFVNRLEKIIQT